MTLAHLHNAVFYANEGGTIRDVSEGFDSLAGIFLM